MIISGVQSERLLHEYDCTLYETWIYLGKQKIKISSKNETSWKIQFKKIIFF